MRVVMTSAAVKKPPGPKHKSRCVSKVSDPRAEKTRALISGAFVLLLGRRPYTRIRVSDVTRKAGVGRATFYAHFASKDALLSAELVRVVHPLLVPLPDDPCLVDCTAFFAHLQHAREIYRSLMAGESRVVAERIVQDALEARIAQIVAQSPTQADAASAPPTFVPRFVASTMLALIAWSLEHPEAPQPAQLQGLYRSLVGRALHAAARD
jgi:AcrR family transcriptional regulator